jgi:hypothetical protein
MRSIALGTLCTVPHPPDTSIHYDTPPTIYVCSIIEPAVHIRMYLRVHVLDTDMSTSWASLIMLGPWR